MKPRISGYRETTDDRMINEKINETNQRISVRDETSLIKNRKVSNEIARKNKLKMLKPANISRCLVSSALATCSLI